MKKSIFIVISIMLAMVLTGCGSYRLASPIQKKETEVAEKKKADDVLIELLSGSPDTTNEVELQLRALLLNGAKIEKRERDSERFLDGSSFSFEKWLVVDPGSNYHLVIIENRVLRKVKAINKLEDWDNYKPFWESYQPAGGWKK